MRDHRPSPPNTAPQPSGTVPKDTPPDPGRRRLLAGASVAGAAALAAGHAPGAEAVAPSGTDDKRSVAYRVTDHVAAYYRRARG